MKHKRPGSMGRFLAAIVCIVVAAGTGLGEPVQSATPKLAKDFRSWTHTKSMVIQDKSNGLYGFHNVYANDAALTALKTNAGFPVGASFVVSFYQILDQQGSLSQGAKIFDATMERRQGNDATGGWVFAAFDADGKPKSINSVSDCFQCHRAAKASGYVFSRYVP